MSGKTRRGSLHQWQLERGLMGDCQLDSRDHPGASRCFVVPREYQPWTPAILQKTERWLSLWQQSGLELGSAILAASSSGKAIAGLAEEEILMCDLPPPDEKTLSLLPNVRVMFDQPRDAEKEFELATRALIYGIYSRLSEH